MGCDLIYSNRTLFQTKAGRGKSCTIVTTSQSSTKPIGIHIASGNNWDPSYLFTSGGVRTLHNNRHYWIEASDNRYIYIDSTGDAWFYKDRASIEAAISTLSIRGASHNLCGTTHYSQVDLSVPRVPVANRYERVIRNLGDAEPDPEPTILSSQPQVEEGPDAELKQILDFEFNKPAPPKQPNPLGLDLEAIARSVLKND